MLEDLKYRGGVEADLRVAVRSDDSERVHFEYHPNEYQQPRVLEGRPTRVLPEDAFKTGERKEPEKQGADDAY